MPQYSSQMNASRKNLECTLILPRRNNDQTPSHTVTIMIVTSFFSFSFYYFYYFLFPIQRQKRIFAISSPSFDQSSIVLRHSWGETNSITRMPFSGHFFVVLEKEKARERAEKRVKDTRWTLKQQYGSRDTDDTESKRCCTFLRGCC